VDLHGETFGTMSALVVNAGVGTAGDVATFRRTGCKSPWTSTSSRRSSWCSRLFLYCGWASTEPLGATLGAKIVALSSITGV